VRQSEQVEVVRILARDTVDETITALQQRRRTTARAGFSSNSRRGAKSLEDDELLLLFGLSY
jgi:SNF2 family DNA or RNA helicase